MTNWREILRPESDTDIAKDYDLSKILGQGSFGVVRLAKHRQTGQLRACKSIPKSKLLTPEDIQDVRREVEILHLLTPHPTVASVAAVYEDKFNVHIVMEYCAGGELFDRIVRKGTFSEAEAAKFFRQMVEMVRHCHSFGVMHRDIKPENFLLSDDGVDPELKACDFGLSAFFKSDEIFSSLIGSAYYVAPEVLRRNYGPKCDVWSLGVVLYILLCGSPPFWGKNEKEVFTSILHGKIDFSLPPWPSVSAPAKEVVQALLAQDPAKRPSTDEMLLHPWLKEHGVAPDKPLDSVVIKRMKEFAGMNRLRKAAVVAAAKHLDKEEITGLRELFKSFDKNGDGVISFEELSQGLVAQGGVFSKNELETMMRETDVDGSGAIDYEEWIAATVNLRLLEREEVLQRLFMEFDADNSGTLTVDEIESSLTHAGLGQIDREEVIQLVRTADTNGDGVVDFSEFKRVFETWRTTSPDLATVTSRRRGFSEELISFIDGMEVDE